jgi:hypothetical protein
VTASATIRLKERLTNNGFLLLINRSPLAGCGNTPTPVGLDSSG